MFEPLTLQYFFAHPGTRYLLETDTTQAIGNLIESHDIERE